MGKLIGAFGNGINNIDQWTSGVVVDTIFGMCLADESWLMKQQMEPSSGLCDMAADGAEMVLMDYVSKKLCRVLVVWSHFVKGKFVFFLVKLCQVVID